MIFFRETVWRKGGGIWEKSLNSLKAYPVHEFLLELYQQRILEHVQRFPYLHLPGTFLRVFLRELDGSKRILDFMGKLLSDLLPGYYLF